MDRPIEETEIRRQRVKTVAKLAAGAVAIIVAAIVLRSMIGPSLKLSRLRTAAVDRGPVEAATLCSGTVVPAAEEVVPCPFDSRVRRVLKEPGATLEQGDPVLELDDTDVRLAVERLQDEVELKRNRRSELELALDGKLSDIRGKSEIQEQRLALLEARKQQLATLHDLGLISVHELRQGELDESIARIELRQLGESEAKEERSTQAQIRGLEIETSLLLRDLDDKKQLLDRAIVRAARGGVLTWVSNEEGASVRDGEVLARVADLTKFEVEVTTSDLHAGRISVGMPTRIEAGEIVLNGRVSSIPPSIQEGELTLKVDIDEEDHHLLRPNLRVDVWIVTELRPNVLRVKKGPFIKGGGEQKIFVMDGDSAERRVVRIGVAGISNYEVIDGVNEGERVVISNMDDHLHLERIRIK
ncbi:MAG: HlyD family efflux transporter periplasmic adaptor subunit [bacterium]|nr:HlyD family efflux transporter periplasmic adaptor subunit [bacterium]